MTNITERVSFLKGKQDEMVKRKLTLMSDSSNAQSIIDMHKEIVMRLDDMQTKAVEQSAGVYNELLTAIVHDVMQDIDQSIELSTKVKHNKPQLFIGSIKNGVAEDIVNDRGGSINNLISAGLRFIAIVQSGNRRFVAMDEQDCWLEERLVPRFIEVLNKLCKEIGVQCLFISHHDKDMIQDKCQVVELNAKQGGIETTVSQSNNTKTDIEHKMGGEWFAGTGIKFIALDNLMSHQATVIPLAPAMTSIVGGNDIGKSVVIRAIDALKNNKPSLNLIRHGQKQASIKFGLEEGMVLHWSIEKNKTGTKVDTPQYTLFDENNKIIKTESSAAGKVPIWVDELLAMGQTPKMDAHIGHQKDPLFILNPAISPAQRAEMVDLGQEFHVIQKMFDLHNDNMKTARQTVKRNQSEIHTINKRLEQLSVLNNVSSVVESTTKSESLRHQLGSEITQIEELLLTLQLSVGNEDALSALNQVVNSKDKGKMVDVDTASKLLALLNTNPAQSLQLMSNLKRVMSNSTDIVDYTPAQQLAKQLSTPVNNQQIALEKLNSVLSQSIEPFTTKAAGAIKVISQYNDTVLNLTEQVEVAKDELLQTDKSWDQAILSHGDSCPCPTCGHTLLPTPG